MVDVACPAAPGCDPSCPGSRAAAARCTPDTAASDRCHRRSAPTTSTAAAWPTSAPPSRGESPSATRRASVSQRRRRQQQRPGALEPTHAHQRPRVERAQLVGDALAMRAHQRRRQAADWRRAWAARARARPPTIDRRRCRGRARRRGAPLHRAPPARRRARRQHGGDAETAAAEEQTRAAASLLRATAPLRTSSTVKHADADPAAHANGPPALNRAQPTTHGADESSNLYAGISRTRSILS